MRLLHRLLAPLLALCFALAPADASSLGQKAIVLSGVQGWSLPGSSADLYFSRNAGSCAILRIAKPCSSLLTTTRASTGYAQWSDGHLSLFAANVPRITDLGLLAEQAATNVVLWNRDLTNAAWTKSNITAALDQTGADGAANSATSLTATGANGTCLQAITLASSARFQSAYVKRLTGTGTINMTLDNGATWTAIVVTAAYTKLTIPTQTLANPTVGFRIVTSGDAIAFDFVQNETGAFATSPIATTTVAVTRAADVITLAGAAATAAAASKAAFAITNLGVGAPATTAAAIFWANSGNAGAFFSATNQIVLRNDTPTTITATLGSGTYGGVVKSAYGYDASSYTVLANGGTKVSTATAFSATGGITYIANRSDGIRALNGYLQRIALGSTKGMFDGLTAP